MEVITSNLNHNYAQAKGTELHQVVAGNESHVTNKHHKMEWEIRLIMVLVICP